MWAFVATTWRLLSSKVGLYVLAAGTLIIALATVASYLISSGKTTERLVQANASLDAVRKEKRIEAANDSLSAADARQRLRDKWSRK